MNVGNNRMKKAVSRTWSWFKEFSSSLETNKVQIFGVLIADPHHPNQADNMIDQLISHGCNGIVIGGAHLDGLGINRAGMTSLEYRRKITKKIREKSSTVFIMTQGADAFDSVSHQFLNSLYS
jgi:queuine/archaeosine tRNA-ribosyltransferase